MTYTFLHRGVVMGESDLSAKTNRAGQRAGAFQPTPYGRTLLPRVTCILVAGLALKAEFEPAKQAGRKKELSQQELDTLLTDSEPGRAMIDVGRVLSEVELRGPDDRRLEFASIAFSNVDEIRRVGQALGTNVHDELKDLPPDAPRFIVSVTLGRERMSVAQPEREVSNAPVRRYVH